MTTASRVGPDGVKTSLPPIPNNSGPRPLATFLGLFSLGLGLAEFLSPRRLSELTGVPRPALLRGYGVREITSGVGILTCDRPAGWLWSRVAGDVIDLATLASAYAEADSEDRRRLMLSAAAVAGVTVMDVLCAREHSRNGH
jgi:hypothetical protein